MDTNQSKTEKTAIASVARAMASVGRAFVIPAVVPSFKPSAIGANDVDVIRGIRPSKYAGLDRSERVAIRNAAKRLYPEMTVGGAVERYMTDHGLDNASRGAQPVLEAAIVARHLGVRHNLSGRDVLGNVLTGWSMTAAFDSAVRAAIAGVSGMATNIGLAIERR